MTLFEQMLSRYDIHSDNDRRNAMYEVMQEITLAGLYRGGFFSHAAFYGGTCLRVFHGMNRFSEDLDFSLIAPDTNFQLETFFPFIVAEFKAMGREVLITKKVKQSVGKVESTFLKDNSDIYNLSFQTDKSIKIKIEVDTNPPLLFQTEQKLLLHPFSFLTRCFVLSDLFAGKMHALVFRAWKTRVKGRDWYDFEWYIRNGTELNFEHLQTRIRQFNGMELDKYQFMDLLKKKLANTNIDMIKQDVTRFIKDPKELDIWSNEYFLQLAGKIRFQ